MIYSPKTEFPEQQILTKDVAVEQTQSSNNSVGNGDDIENGNAEDRKGEDKLIKELENEIFIDGACSTLSFVMKTVYDNIAVKLYKILSTEKCKSTGVLNLCDFVSDASELPRVIYNDKVHVIFGLKMADIDYLQFLAVNITGVVDGFVSNDDTVYVDSLYILNVETIIDIYYLLGDIMEAMDID